MPKDNNSIDDNYIKNMFVEETGNYYPNDNKPVEIHRCENGYILRPFSTNKLEAYNQLVFNNINDLFKELKDRYENTTNHDK